MITIIDYKSGNLKSISNGFKKIGAEYQITDDKEVIANSDYLVLPGVGAFGSAVFGNLSWPAGTDEFK